MPLTVDKAIVGLMETELKGQMDVFGSIHYDQ
jgi:hypothetical protein